MIDIDCIDLLDSHLVDKLKRFDLDFYKAGKPARSAITEEIHEDIPILKWCAFCAREVTAKAKYVNACSGVWASLALLVMGGACCSVSPCSDRLKEFRYVCTTCGHEVK